MRGYVPIADEVLAVERRLRLRNLARGLSVVWCGGLIAAAWAIASGDRDAASLAAIGLITLGVAAGFAMVMKWRRPDVRHVALRVEQTFPELETRLLAALEQEENAPAGSRGYLEEAVIREARSHALTHDR